jgi:hypothetical protein
MLTSNTQGQPIYVKTCQNQKVQQLSFQLAQVTMGWEVRGGVDKALRTA